MRFLCHDFARSELFIARREGRVEQGSLLEPSDRDAVLSILSRGTVEPDTLHWALRQIACPDIWRMSHHLVLARVADAILGGELCLVVRRLPYGGGPPDLAGGGAADWEEAKRESDRERIAAARQRQRPAGGRRAEAQPAPPPEPPPPSAEDEAAPTEAEDDGLFNRGAALAVLAEEETAALERLEMGTNGDRRRYGPAHATAVDRRNLDSEGNPRVFTGQNLGRAFDPAELHPTLAARREAYLADETAMARRRRFPNPGDPPDGSANTGDRVDGDPGHHAEVQAVNAALKAREDAGLDTSEAALEEILVSVRRVRPKPGQSGAQFGCCNDCSVLLGSDPSVDFPDAQSRQNELPEGAR